MLAQVPLIHKMQTVLAHQCFGTCPAGLRPTRPVARFDRRTSLAFTGGRYSSKAARDVSAASLTVKEDKTGIEFPLAQTFWEGDVNRCLGAGARLKKILMLSVKVYAVSLYVEAEKAARELGIRQRGGFFSSDDDYCQALLDGAFNKALVIHMARDVDGLTFAEAINDALAPRMKLTGESALLQQFVDYLADKKLAQDSEVVVLWNSRTSDLEVLLQPAVSGGVSYGQVQPGLRINSPGMCRAMFEVYLGEKAVVPEAKPAWVVGAKALLDSELVKRDTRKPM